MDFHKIPDNKVKVRTDVFDHFFPLLFLLHDISGAVGPCAESCGLFFLELLESLLPTMDDSSDGPTVLIPEPVTVLQVDGVLRHEDEVVQDDLLLRLFVVFDDRGQEEVEQAKHDEEDHEGEEDVGEDHGDRAP